MYNNPYLNNINAQSNIDRINNEISNLQKLKEQMQQNQATPTNLTQNFQIAPNHYETMRYANSIEEVEKNSVIGDTPYFSRDMSVVWVKNAKGEIKTYELKEIIPKDDKDMQIELLQAQINEMKGMIESARSNDEYVDESTKSEKSKNVSVHRTSTKKSK